MTSKLTHSTGDLTARSASWALVVLLAARLILGVAYSALIPLGEAPDEADHYAYAAFIAREHRLPSGTGMTQAKHPPLFHVLAAVLVDATGADADFAFLRSNPDAGVGPDAAAPNFFIHTGLERWPWQGGALAMHLGRLVSVLAGLTLVAATYALGRAAWPAWYAGPLAAAAFVAFLPETLFIGGALNNDLLAAMWVTLALWLGLRGRRLRWAAGAGLTLGLAVVTKASTAMLAPVIAAAILLPPGYSFSALCNPFPRHWTRPAIGRVWVAAALALLVAAPWLWRNWRLWGDPLGWPLVLATIDRRGGPLVPADYIWLAKGWFQSFWGKFGAAGHLPMPFPFYAVWAALLVAAALGWLLPALRARRRGLSAAGWVTLVGAVGMTVVGIISYSRTALGTDQGRLLFPAVAPIALLISSGITAWLPVERTRWLPVGMGVGMAAIALLALVVGIVIPYAAPRTPSAAEVARAIPVAATFGDSLELVATRWDFGSADAGVSSLARAGVTLYWRAARPLAQDLRPALRLLDGSGNLLWEWKRSPAAGRFSTDRWPTGRLVRDVYAVPEDLLAGAARIELGVQPFPTGDWLPAGGQPGTQFLQLSVP